MLTFRPRSSSLYAYLKALTSTLRSLKYQTFWIPILEKSPLKPCYCHIFFRGMKSLETFWWNFMVTPFQGLSLKQNSKMSWDHRLSTIFMPVVAIVAISACQHHIYELMSGLHLYLFKTKKIRLRAARMSHDILAARTHFPHIDWIYLFVKIGSHKCPL